MLTFETVAEALRCPERPIAMPVGRVIVVEAEAGSAGPHALAAAGPQSRLLTFM
jgi:hypothetical protein